MKRFYTVLYLFLLVSPWQSGCARRHPAGVQHAAITKADALAQLRDDLDRIFSDPNFSNAQWGVEVVSLDTGAVLFERNATRLYLPASNNKLLTGAAALMRLGADYRYQTRVLAQGDVSGGVLRGNLLVIGSGDPSIGPRFSDGDPFRVFKSWAALLKQKGITRIDGNVVGDEGAFAQPPFGAGWEWDDLSYGYAAPVTALQFNENTLTLEITPGGSNASPASVNLTPMKDLLDVETRVTTGAPGIGPDITVASAGDSGRLVVAGTVPLRSETVRRSVAAASPGHLFLNALRRTLEAEGVAVSGHEEVVRNTDCPRCTLVFTHASPSLGEILKPLLKVSQNLYAETFARTLGLVLAGQGSFERGRDVVESTLRDMGIEIGTYSYADGSGMSRLNLISADLLVRLLKYMHRQPSFQLFYDALPVAGIDGTIADRMKGTRAENNVHAKTGTLMNVRSLSGYVRTADGEMLAFSMLANNFLTTPASAEYVQDTALQRLASFRR